MNTSELILPNHLTRRAVVYIRQSTTQQVATNQESLRLQYALTQRANELGWPDARVDVVDADLGRSGATTEGRLGFQELVAQVALGQIGILIAYDATRLARNCAHWYQLLDLCGRDNCLIADRDGVYDPSSVNGRLLLGLKGQISELELHTIRARMSAGIMSKAKRGDLEVCLPTGLERTADGEVIKTPDREVQDRLTLIFQSMLEQRTAPRVLRLLKEQELRIPRRDHCGEIQWRQPTTTCIINILRNPAYAGAFAYGRTRIRYENGVPTKRRDSIPADQWKALVKDKYPAYVSWEDFERIGAMLDDNRSEYQRRMSRGVPRDGKVLLQGIAYCGHCGRKMTIQYKDKSRYSCSIQSTIAREPVCQFIWSDAIDHHVLQCFFEALSVAEIDLSARTLQESDRRRDDLLGAQSQQLERLRYNAQLAERRYRHSEPENRLVTAELERRWEEALRELQTAEDSLAVRKERSQCWAIPADLLESLKDIGPRLPELWNERLLSWSQKKSLLRCLIEKVVLKRDNDQVGVRVVWRGGDVSELTVPVTVGRFEQLTAFREIEETIVAMAKKGEKDKTIAAHLTSAGHRSPRSNVVLPSTVARIRKQHGIVHQEKLCHPHVIAGYLRPYQLAQRLEIRPHWIYDRIRNGTIKVEKHPMHKAFLFPDTPETLEKLQQFVDGQVDSVSF
jgi:DNA invertase Pin-like site-specific DNA recombinase